MSVVLVLEDFGSDKSGTKKVVISEESIEDSRLSAFEGGYKAGWDDATVALTTEQRNVIVQINQHLMDASFTYHEVKSQLLTSIEHLFLDIFEKFIPSIASECICLQIKNELLCLVKSRIDDRIRLAVAQSSYSHIEELLQHETLHQVSLEVDIKLTAGQIYLQAGEAEKLFDIELFARDAKLKISNFLKEQQGQFLNG
jgi:hypothetical protein